MRKLLLTILSVAAFTCLHAQVDLTATQSVKNLYGNLKEVAWDTKDILFGQEFFNSYSWATGNHEDENFSDCQQVTGQHPGVLGQDFHYYIYKDATEKRKHKEAALRAYALGCVVTFDFHMYSKYHNSTDYAPGDQYLMYNIGNNIDTYGEVTWCKSELDKIITVINSDLNIPIVLRLFHEMNGGWFWWGTQAYGGAAAYNKFYQFASTYIKDRTNNVLFAWSPNYPWNTSYYPGNSYVDVVGLDMYDIGTSQGPTMDVMVSQLTSVSDFAWTNNKIPVFAETGNRVDSPDTWAYWWYNVNEKLQASNRAWKVAWMLTWINVNWGNVPYVAHNGSSATAKTALTSFANMSTILMQPEALSRNMYNTSYLKSARLYADIDDNGAKKVLIYPNPVSSDLLTVDLQKLKSIAVNVSITDILGRNIYNKLTKNEDLHRISVSELSKGVFFVKISAEGYNETQKIIIQ